METRLPIPKNWEDFEIICHRLWKEMWGDPHAQREGRKGQPQNGVDIWGLRLPDAKHAGVQCKDRDLRYGHELTAEELGKECEKAKAFEPALEEFTLATTTARDAKLQKAARDLNGQNAYPFSVHVWSWDDIEEEIRFRPLLRSSFYPDHPATPDEAKRIILSVFPRRNEIQDFFARPDIEAVLARSVRNVVRTLAFELSENAFRHGKATRFCLECKDDTIVFEDNGVAFDPLTSLDATKASFESHLGSLVFERFRRQFGSDVRLVYERDAKLNRLSFRFAHALSSFPSPNRIEIPVDLMPIFSRDAAMRAVAALALPDDVSQITLIVTGIGAHSGAFSFFHHLLGTLKRGVNLKLVTTDRDYFNDLKEWVDDPRVTLELLG